MWFLQRMQQISLTSKKSGETMLQEPHTTRSLVNTIYKRHSQATFFGHMMSKNTASSVGCKGK